MRRHCLTCRALIAAGSYCERCRPRNGSKRAWRELREQILTRDRWACVVCGEPATEVDHIVEVRDGGTDHPGNLRSLCAEHHRESHRSAA
jgi:5-methylcytosine-specific restriction endonuclease McrA